MKILVTFYFPFFVPRSNLSFSNIFFPPHSLTYLSSLSFFSSQLQVPKFEYKKNLLISSWILNLIGFRFYDSRREMGEISWYLFFSRIFYAYKELWKSWEKIPLHIHACIAHFKWHFNNIYNDLIKNFIYKLHLSISHACVHFFNLFWLIFELLELMSF